MENGLLELAEDTDKAPKPDCAFDGVLKSDAPLSAVLEGVVGAIGGAAAVDPVVAVFDGAVSAIGGAAAAPLGLDA